MNRGLGPLAPAGLGRKADQGGGAPGLPAFAWQQWRDRLLASPRFQRWASGFWLTRPIARRRARALFDLCAGFVYSQVLAACVRLRLFEALAGGPLPLAALAHRLGLSPAAAERLLLAAAALRLVSRRRDGWGLGSLGAAMLGNPGVAAMVEHHAMLYADLRDPVALLRGEAPATELSRYWPYAACGAASPEAEQVAAYSRLMAASLPLVAEDVLDAYDVRRHRCLLDVGGGEGRFLAAVAARAPDVQLMLFDLPAVADRARAALGPRAAVFGGDMHLDPLPTGADLISLVRVIHDHDDAPALALLRRARAALPPGGTLLLAEPMAGAPGAAPIGDAYFGMYLLAMGSGRARTPETLAAMLREAGFAHTCLLRTRRPMLVQAIVART